jgi:hypothetical protein
MIVNNYKNAEENYKKIECLFKEFGSGVHLVRNKHESQTTGVNEFELMIISHDCSICMFIDTQYKCFEIRKNSHKEVDKGTPSFRRVLPYEIFYEEYEYIKKLKTHELIVYLDSEVDE